jgi:hypothetical protein
MNNVKTITEIPAAKKRGGRPTIRRDDILKTILKGAETGAPAKACCAAAGISYEAWRSWQLADPAIEEQFQEARERARVKALAALQDAFSKDWRSAADWLRLAHRNEYAPKAEITVETTGRPDMIVIDAAMLDRLQAEYKQMQNTLFEKQLPYNPQGKTEPKLIQ